MDKKLCEMTLKELQEWRINQALLSCGGNIKKAAVDCGVSRAKIYRFLQRSQKDLHNDTHRDNRDS